jgi:hypothetical protein
MAMRILVIVNLLFLLACQSAEVRRVETVENVAAKLAHLGKHPEIVSTVHVNFAEPIKEKWMARYAPQNPAPLFKQFQEVGFIWRATPHRCRIRQKDALSGPAQFKELIEDTEKKLSASFCVWLQSFYTDSPLRGWKHGDGHLEDRIDGIEIVKGLEKGIEFKPDGTRVSARLGEGSTLTGYFKAIDGNLYPQKIEFQNGDQRGDISDFSYAKVEGRQRPQTFWLNLNLGDGRPSAYLKAELDKGGL